jgi:hypothetical protein
LDIKELYEYIEEEQQLSYLPIETLGREHDINSYTNFHRLLNRVWNYNRGKGYSNEELEESDRLLVEGYTIYTNNKGRLIRNASQKGIDKISNNYKPWAIEKHLDANYSIRVIQNTFVNHIIVTVGFTIAEYFGSSTEKDTITGKEYSVPFKYDKNSIYNLVQVVHGRKFIIEGNFHRVPVQQNRLRNCWSII